MTPVILTFEIDKIQPGEYRVAVTCRGGEVTKPLMFQSIEEGIRERALDVPEGWGHFVEVRYHDVSSGTLRRSDVPGQARAIADHLVALMAEVDQVAKQG